MGVDSTPSPPACDIVFHGHTHKQIHFFTSFPFSDKYGAADKHRYRAGCTTSVPDDMKWSEYEQQGECIDGKHRRKQKSEFVVRVPKRKMKRLGDKNIETALTGNVRKLAAAFDHTVGGGNTNEAFKKDSALQDKILHFENFQGKKAKTIVETTTKCWGAWSPRSNISCVGTSQDQQQARGESDGLSGPMGGGQRLGRPHPRGMWEGGGAEKRGSHRKSPY